MPKPRLVIEDLILVTANGREILTDSVPRVPDDVAAIIAEEGLLDWFNKARTARPSRAPSRAGCRSGR